MNLTVEKYKHLEISGPACSKAKLTKYRIYRKSIGQ